MNDILDMLPSDATHRDAERVFTEAGWTPCGAGDWAIALRVPDGTMAVRISPFDPTGPYTAELYREAAHTRQMPQLFAHRRLVGGGDLQVTSRRALDETVQKQILDRLGSDIYPWHQQDIADRRRAMWEPETTSVRF